MMEGGSDGERKKRFSKQSKCGPYIDSGQWNLMFGLFISF